MTDPLFFYSYYKVSTLLDPTSIFTGWTGWAMVIGWYVFTKTVKLAGLFRRYPADIFYLPVSIAFGFYHGVIKLNALYTWNEVSRAPPSPLSVCLSLAHANANADQLGQSARWRCR